MNVNSLKFKFFLKILKWLLSSYKYETEGMETIKKLSNSNSLVFAALHGQMTGCMHFIKNYENILSIASKSKDGEIAAAIFNYLGVKKLARGSSSRGGKEAMIELISSLNEKSNIVMLVDGPKGPRLKVKPGVIYIAKHTDKIIIPTVFYCKHYIQFKSWDKFTLPYPYSTLKIFYGKPFYVSDNTDKETINNETTMLEEKIKELVIAHSPFML
jgi:lysophospholipid acyltransferase (LPLAT)-like uncharacterized protein